MNVSDTPNTTRSTTRTATIARRLRRRRRSPSAAASLPVPVGATSGSSATDAERRRVRSDVSSAAYAHAPTAATDATTTSDASAVADHSATPRPMTSSVRVSGARHVVARRPLNVMAVRNTRYDECASSTMTSNVRSGRQRQLGSRKVTLKRGGHATSTSTWKSSSSSVRSLITTPR